MPALGCRKSQCKRGHLNPLRTRGGACVICVKEYKRKPTICLVCGKPSRGHEMHPDCWTALAAWRGQLRLMLGMNPLPGDLGNWAQRQEKKSDVVWWDSWAAGGYSL